VKVTSIAVLAQATARSAPFFAELRKRHDPELVAGEKLPDPFLRSARIDRSEFRFGRSEIMGPLGRYT
jgi:hypothetical protein